MPWVIGEALQARQVRQSLPPGVRERLRRVRTGGLDRAGLDQPLSLARFVALDLETTGPRMLVDQIIAIGAVAVVDGTARHDDAFEALLRQDRASNADNVLVHQIGGQAQLGGLEPVEALVRCLEFVGAAPVVAFRAEFDQTVLRREVRARLGLRAWPRFIDLAALLPALFPGAQNDSLDDWARHFGLPAIGRHHSMADAYATAQLLMIVLQAAPGSGVVTVRDLCEAAQAQRWLGRRR